MKLSIVGKVFFLVTGLAIIMMLCGYNIFSKEMMSDLARRIGRQLMVYIVVFGSLTIYWRFHPFIALLLLPMAALFIIIGIFLVS